MVRRAVTWRTSLAVLAIALSSPSAGDADTFRTRRFIQRVSQDPFGGIAGSEADTQVEPYIAIDPNDPAVVVAVFQEGRFDLDGGSVDTGFATSHDGGRTWITGNLPGLTAAVGGAFDRASDPVVAIARDGAVYAQSLVFDVADCRSAVAVQRSDDRGLTFGDPVLVHEDCSAFNDKNWIAVDTFPASPHYGRLYSAWDLSGGGAPIVLSYSDDRGATWSPLVTVSDASVTAGVGALPLVQPNGDVTVVYEAYAPSPARELSQTSHDGGVSFDPAVTVGIFEGHDVPAMRTGIGLPAAAVDPVNGRLHAVWPDARFRSDTLNDIVLSTSMDGGASWGPLDFVNHDGAARRSNHCTPAVAASGGTVLVTFRSRREDSRRVETRWVVSADGGGTFTRERRLGRATDVRFAATAGGVNAFLGDYMGVALSAEAAHAVWCNALRPRLKATHHQTTWSATILR
jgi:hypothetical protein